MNWFLALLRFLREVLSEDGQGSWSRVGSAVVVAALVCVMVVARSIPERTEELAFVIGVVYGMNQLKAFGRWLTAGRPQPPGNDAALKSLTCAVGPHRALQQHV